MASRRQGRARAREAIGTWCAKAWRPRSAQGPDGNETFVLVRSADLGEGVAQVEHGARIAAVLILGLKARRSIS